MQSGRKYGVICGVGVKIYGRTKRWVLSTIQFFKEVYITDKIY